MCRICSSKDGLQVHHRNYKNKGKEDELKDLITLCAHCHGLYHGKVEDVDPRDEERDLAILFAARKTAVEAVVTYALCSNHIGVESFNTSNHDLGPLSVTLGISLVDEDKETAEEFWARMENEAKV